MAADGSGYGKQSRTNVVRAENGKRGMVYAFVSIVKAEQRGLSQPFRLSQMLAPGASTKVSVSGSLFSIDGAIVSTSALCV